MYYSIFIEYCAADLFLTELFKFSCGEINYLLWRWWYRTRRQCYEIKLAVLIVFWFFLFFLLKRKLMLILDFSSVCQRKLVENILFLRTRWGSNSADICWPLSRLGVKQSLLFWCCRGVSRMQDSLFNKKNSNICLLSELFLSISCVVNNRACYDVIEEWDSHRNQNWLYQKKHICCCCPWCWKTLCVLK